MGLHDVMYMDVCFCQTAILHLSWTVIALSIEKGFKTSRCPAHRGGPYQ